MTSLSSTTPDSHGATTVKRGQLKNTDRLYNGSDWMHSYTGLDGINQLLCFAQRVSGMRGWCYSAAQTGCRTAHDNHPLPGTMSCFAPKVVRVSSLLSAIMTGGGHPKLHSETSPFAYGMKCSTIAVYPSL